MIHFVACETSFPFANSFLCVLYALSALLLSLSSIAVCNAIVGYFGVLVLGILLHTLLVCRERFIIPEDGETCVALCIGIHVGVDLFHVFCRGAFGFFTTN